MGEPRIKFNQNETNILSLIDQEPELECWFYNNFIHLIVGMNAHWGMFLFGNHIVRDCPWVDAASVQRSFVQEDIIDFVKDKINQEIYVWMNVESGGIPVYETIIRFHDIFLYGYDDEAEEFYAADFFRDGHYTRERISYARLAAGYAGMSNYKDNLGICLVWKKKSDSYKNVYTDSAQLIKRGIEDYMAAVYPFSPYKYMENTPLQNLRYGADIYPVLLTYCDKLAEGEDRLVDYRLFDLLYRHKSVMHDRLIYLSGRGYEGIIPEIQAAKELVKRSIVLRNMFLKYAAKQDRKIMELIKVKLIELQEYEASCYTRILDIL
ncbi:MAG: hypothetical protein K0S04_1797 [Herbinix sp.]|jgi:hypothetical protein|nr:hypothetical protein [Herbinix sp.]